MIANNYTTTYFTLPCGRTVAREVFEGRRAVERRGYGRRCDAIRDELGAVSWHRARTL